MSDIHFVANVPQVLTLKETAGCLDGFNVLYETSDGKTLTLPRPAAIKLNELDPMPGEEISITKCRKDREPAEWVIASTARTERARAETEALELARCTLRDPEGQLAKSIAAVRQGKGVRVMPKLARQANGEAPEVQKGTGTYGPVPQVALGGRKEKPEAVPMNVAFRECVRFVTAELNASGERWSENSRQDLVSTVLIAAQKQGLLGVWER